MASPIQIILNDRDYEQARDVGGGGPRKDFFANRDKEFRQHKAALISQLNTIAHNIEGQSQGDLGYIKVILRRSAWAKSHRPLGVLFKRDRITMAGGGDLGEMYFEARPAVLREIAAEIAKAENETTLKFDEEKGKDVPHPSARRSEAGAIERIDIYGPQDRRSFSVEEGISWLSNPMTGSSYEIELFDVPPPRNQWDAFDEGRQRTYMSFVEGLASVGQGLTAQRQFMRDQAQPLLSVRITQSAAPPTVQLGSSPPVERRRERELAPFDPALQRHRRLLRFLDNHPLVRHIDLPPVIVRTVDGFKIAGQSAAASERPRPKKFAVPERDSKRSYPRVGIIDGGISRKLEEWVISRWDVLDAGDMDHDHGTFIGGLAVAGNALNGSEICPEPDGAEIADLAVYPSDGKPGAFRSYYPDGAWQLFDEIEYAVADAKTRHNIRIFNMSLNVQTPAQPDRYSHYAARFDQIAEANNAILFVPTGNTRRQDLRPEWVADETRTLIGLAAARNDGLLMPAESVRNVAIAAVNPVGVEPSIPFAPARYSRRGPGLRAGVKPDLACIGGCGTPHSRLGHGLFSIYGDGTVEDACGTSFAAPLAVKSAAVLEHSIEGEVSRETLIALLLHHAQMPGVLRTKAMKGLARHLAGFGVPMPAKDVLEGDDHQITLVFASRLRKDQQIAFRFAWPPSMVLANGECRGSARLTLVSTPPLNPRFGSEFVRVNIDAVLQQEDFAKDGKPGWRKRLDAIYLPGSAEAPVIEAERIEHGLKWSPIKAYAKTMPRGVGKSSNWRLFINYLTRAGEDMPEPGVPFTAILTISDPERRHPVFRDMRQSLNALGVRIEDIRTAARVVTRV
jgi:Subtilase family